MTMSFKGAIKYTLYIFISGWMFLLGIMVGRGTAPVTFETKGFQERLLEIAQKMKYTENTKNQDSKIALHYYEALSEPGEPEELPMMAADEAGGRMKQDVVAGDRIQVEVTDMQDLPDAHQRTQPDAIPVKISKKSATLHMTFTARHADNSEKNQEPARSGKSALPEKSEPDPDAAAGSGTKTNGAFTIQVAAFKSFKDAVTQAVILDEKGFAATRTSKEIDGVTWYRVRLGTFATREAAHRQLEKLNQAGINGMIIKKE